MNEYISKQDMLNAVETLDIIPSVDGMGIPADTEDFRVQFLGTVLKVGSADVAPVVHGKWTKLFYDGFNCNKCGSTFVIMQGRNNMYYCPNCGAKMDAQGEE